MKRGKLPSLGKTTNYAFALRWKDVLGQLSSSISTYFRTEWLGHIHNGHLPHRKFVRVCTSCPVSDLDENSRGDYRALREAWLCFGNGGKLELFRSQLKNRSRGTDESLPELAQAIQRLVRQAYSEAPLSVREVLEKDYFVDAITDIDIRWKILQSRLRTIQEAPRHGHQSGGISGI